MKKTFKSKLRLNSQTIRNLNAARLEAVAGARLAYTDQASCDGDCATVTCGVSCGGGCPPRGCG
jgi:hypothetical protein